MLNKVSELSKRTLSNTSPEEDIDAGPLEALLEGDRERITHVIASTSGIEHTTNDRTTTIEPNADQKAYAVVTNRQIHFVLGSEPDTAEVSFHLGDVASAELKDGLLSSTLQIRTPDESIRFTPEDTEDGEAVADYVRRIGSCWSDFEDTLVKVREAIDDLEAKLAAGEDAQRTLQTARSRVSKAHHCATHHDDAPTELMVERIEPIEAEIDRLQVTGRIDTVEEHLDEARQAHEDGEFEAAFDALGAAREMVADATEALDGVEDDVDAADAVEEYAADCTALAEKLLDDAEQCCHVAMDAEDPADAVEAWEEALARYRAALAADWEGEDVDTAALRFQLSWVVGSLIDSLAARAAAIEDEADDLEDGSDEAVDRYESAREPLVRARDLAADHPHADEERLAEPIERVDEKIERAQWQWGSAD